MFFVATAKFRLLLITLHSTTMSKYWRLSKHACFAFSQFCLLDRIFVVIFKKAVFEFFPMWTSNGDICYSVGCYFICFKYIRYV